MGGLTSRVALRRAATGAQILWLVLFAPRVITGVPVAPVMQLVEWAALALAAVSLAVLSWKRAEG